MTTFPFQRTGCGSHDNDYHGHAMCISDMVDDDIAELCRICTGCVWSLVKLVIPRECVASLAGGSVWSDILSVLRSFMPVFVEVRSFNQGIFAGGL